MHARAGIVQVLVKYDQPSNWPTDRVERRTKLPSSWATCTVPAAIFDAADALLRRLGFFVLADNTYRTTTAMAAKANTTSAGITSGVANISAAVFVIFSWVSRLRGRGSALLRQGDQSHTQARAHAPGSALTGTLEECEDDVKDDDFG